MPATAFGAARPVLVDARLDKSVVGPLRSSLRLAKLSYRDKETTVILRAGCQALGAVWLASRAEEVVE